MSLPDLAVRRPITTAMALLSVLLFGGIAFSRLPLAYLPEVDVPFIGVQIPYPNTNPAQVEREIVKPAEEILATLSGIKRMRATADADGAFVALELDWGEELDVARMQVSEKMDQLEPQLPDGAGDVLIFSFSTSDIPVVQGRISAQGVDLSAHYELIEARILNRLRRIPGVARVDLDGVRPRQVFIDLELDKVLAHGVDVGALIQRLRANAANLVLGEVTDGGLRYAARAVGGYASMSELERLEIGDRGLKLADVATVSLEEPPIAHGRHLNRQQAIAVTVFKESTANTVEVVRAVGAVISGEIDADPLLQGIDFFVWEDQAEQITSAIDGLRRAGLWGALLAVLVLYVFLRRLRATLIVSLSIPFSIVAACGVMYFLGKSLNILSMMGLMLGVGMLVDNAIVVLESIERRGREARDRRQAARDGASQVWLAVLASTATSLIVFLPLVVGAKTELSTWLAEIGITICLALSCSLISSLTLIPLVAARFLATGRAQPNRGLAWLEARYATALAWTLAHRAATFALLLAVAAVGFAPFVTGLIETGMFSADVNERLFLRYDFADFVYKSQAEAVVDRVEEYLASRQQELGIASIYSFYAADRAETTLTLARRDLGDRAFGALREEIRSGLPAIPGVRLRFEEDEDDGGSTSFSLSLYGQDSAALAAIAAEAERRLTTVAGVADLTTSLAHAQREIEVRVDRRRAARLGLTAEDVSQAIGFTLGAVRLPRWNDGRREVDASLALRLEDRENLADLKEIPLRAVGGRPVRLGDVARFVVVDKPQQIERENRKVRVAVRATYEGDDWPGTRREIEGLMSTLHLPGGYSWSWSSRILEQDTQDQQMGVNMLLALVLVYLVMASLFESLVQPFAILFAILFALPGAGWALALTGTPFNLMAQIGLLILMGIVVNNGIVLLDHLNQLRRSGVERHAAVLAAGRDRLRAILMTASTTIVGLLPLAVGGSQVGGLFYYPLAITVIGGLASSAVLTLLALPSVNLGVESLADWGRSLWAASGTAAAAEPAELEAAPADGLRT